MQQYRRDIDVFHAVVVFHRFRSRGLRVIFCSFYGTLSRTG